MPFYRVVEVWKDTSPLRLDGRELTLAPELGTYRLLGYTPRGGQDVVLLYDMPGWAANRPIELMPIAEDRVIYAASDVSVRRVTVSELRRLVLAR